MNTRQSWVRKAWTTSKSRDLLRLILARQNPARVTGQRKCGQAWPCQKQPCTNTTPGAWPSRCQACPANGGATFGTASPPGAVPSAQKFPFGILAADGRHDTVARCGNRRIRRRPEFVCHMRIIDNFLESCHTMPTWNATSLPCSSQCMVPHPTSPAKARPTQPGRVRSAAMLLVPFGEAAGAAFVVPTKGRFLAQRPRAWERGQNAPASWRNIGSSWRKIGQQIKLGIWLAPRPHVGKHQCKTRSNKYGQTASR